MKMFFDENFSPHLARGFSKFQVGRSTESVEVLHVVDEFGRGTADEEWIPRVAQMHGVIITQDFNIHRTRHLAELCRTHKTGVFFFRPPKSQPYGYWQLIEWVLKQWESIKSCAQTTPTHMSSRSVREARFLGNFEKPLRVESAFTFDYNDAGN